MTMSPADQVLALFSSRGHEHHGEVIDQQSHALQSAVLAQAVGADDALVVAATLSPTSIETLQAQGGLLDTEAVARFEAHRGHADALALRGWDEAAKDPHVTTVGLDEFRALLQRVAITEG